MWLRGLLLPVALAAGELPPSFAGVAAAVPPASDATVPPARPLPAA